MQPEFIKDSREILYPWYQYMYNRALYLLILNMKNPKELQAEIRELLKKRNALMLAHNYQRDEVQETADICGDSLALSQAAAKSDVEAIVFCGVHFMAESASILCPDKTVILPRLDAGCPMAYMITAENLRKEKEKRPDV